MLLPTMLLLGNCLSFAPSPQFRLDLPEGEGRAEWYSSKPGRTDLYGDPLPEGAMARIGTARFRPAGTILDVAFSTDSRTLAAASHECVYLLDAATGKPLARFTAPNAVGFTHVAFLPQGNYLVTQTYRGRILFWKLSSERTRPLQGPETDQPSPFAMSGNGKFLAFTKDKTIRLWDITRGKEIDQLDRRESAYRLSFSADGKFLASLGGRRATLWDVPSGKSLRHFPPEKEGDERKPLGRPEGHSIREFVLSPDGKILAGFRRPLTGQADVCLWETATGKELHVLRVNDATNRSLTFTPDGRLLALGSQHHLQFWDVRTGETSWRVPMPVNQFFSLRFSPDGRFVAAGQSSRVKIWETMTGRERYPFPELRDLSFFSLSPDGRTVLTAKKADGGVPDKGAAQSEEADLRFWDASNGNRLLTSPGQKKHFPLFAALSGDQKTLVTWETEPILQVWDVDSGKKLGRIPYETYPDTRLLSDDGKFLVLGSRGSGSGVKDVPSRLVLWDAQTGKRLGELKGHRSFFLAMRFSPDGKMLASIDGNHALHLWETTTQKELFQLKPKSAGFALAFSRDSRMLAVVSPDSQRAAFGEGVSEMVFLEIPSGKELLRVPKDKLPKMHRIGIYDLLFSPSGKRMIAVDYSGKMFVWERETGRLVKEWQADEYGVSRLALSADGKVLLTQQAFTALIWDLGELLTRD